LVFCDRAARQCVRDQVAQGGLKGEDQLIKLWHAASVLCSEAAGGGIVIRARRSSEIYYARKFLGKRSHNGESDLSRIWKAIVIPKDGLSAEASAKITSPKTRWREVKEKWDSHKLNSMTEEILNRKTS
jgi:hypothetical protein